MLKDELAARVSIEELEAGVRTSREALVGSEVGYYEVATFFDTRIDLYRFLRDRLNEEEFDENLKNEAGRRFEESIGRDTDSRNSAVALTGGKDLDGIRKAVLAHEIDLVTTELRASHREEELVGLVTMIKELTPED